MIPDKLSLQPTDRIERLAPPAVKLAGLLMCAILLYQAGDSSSAFPPLPQSMLYRLYYIGIITPLHEGGHFLFMFFGRTLYILGGSFWQVFTPLLLFGVAFRQKSFLAWIWLSLGGTHFIALSPYIMDAPFRTLPLLGGHKSGHDWYNLLIHWQLLDEALPISDAVYNVGMGIGVVGILAGILVAFRQYLRPVGKNPSPLISE
jgi:hypothetical protein